MHPGRIVYAEHKFAMFPLDHRQHLLHYLIVKQLKMTLFPYVLFPSY